MGLLASDDTEQVVIIRRLERRLVREQDRRANAEKIAEEKTRELHLRLVEAEQDFTKAQTHALRTPLRAIHGFSEILEQEYGERLGPDGNGLTHRIRVNVNRMSQLLDGMQRVSQVSNQPVQRVMVDISAIAERTLSDLSLTSQRSNIKWVVEPSINLEGDPRLLAVLLRELLENAWRFTEPVSEPQIVVGKQPNRPHGAFFVRDNGIGLATAFADKCFNLFDTAHPTAHEQVGMGIGLATARIIVERHRGSIWCQSAPGEGATFFVAVLPLTS